MLITPVPGVNREHLLDTLNSLHNSLVSIQAAGPISAVQRAQRYLEWTHEIRRMLRRQIHPDSLEHLIPGRNYEVVLTAAAALRDVNLAAAQDPYGVESYPQSASKDGARQLNGLLGMLMDEHVEALNAARESLTKEMQRFQRDAVLAVLDTNIYMEHPQHIEDIDLAALLHAGFEPIHILVPLVVIDELDKGKRSGWNGWKAAYSLAYIDRIDQQGGLMREKDMSHDDTARGQVTIEVVLDPPGHVRLPNNDDEIVSRALAIKTLAGKQVRLLTYDTGMAMRGRAAGLQVRWLEQSPKDKKRQARRRPGGEADDGERRDERGPAGVSG
ncbi:PIN domain-containing protein [Micromonospora sp. NPDC126480]|uniref:PIN domain-containing protein n=1 Tax=Micromonospora sp. NPDC126480 TaxID=3155312 RepID=UPI0033286454